MILTDYYLIFKKKKKLTRSDIYVLDQMLAYTIHGKKLKSHTKTMNLKYQLQHEIKI